ncbi:exopolyphosphatase/guanosine-5'-triphosphate,3'-diphosphate pyrophosphatase [Mobilisporobacter senegalensis]|uniref:Exopolyphosphatase/guanosine-5'-triphosphate, 3'-diphosphate pyrophosphatase n=1 Tax=Mobilisporobacter senegalensis TaxID=1329262 RepID=A0A3N1XRL5_9FIRM|nr:rod shape-determining protein [Mobilisporobacter senegalensis]ROR29275.1 exopolyphosphatase/guanosine-5'-triphosphate,3'-diphosphate pyrophosphatase [Mobilisporobacter senegalensis]
MKYAIVDLGSNTIRLCVYEVEGEKADSIFERKTMAGLVNYITNDILNKDGIERAISILKDYQEILKNLLVNEENVYVFATASLRNIVNTKEVIKIIKESTSLSVELLSGEEEATLDFIGATKNISSNTGVLVDIGGGSTEIVAFKNKEIQYAKSMPIGSLNLYVKHVKKIIPKEDERKQIKRTVLENLKTLEIEPETYETICGVGGTMRAAAKLNNSIFNIPKTNHLIDGSNIKLLLEIIKNSHKTTITPILQNIPDRIHTIIPGIIIIDTILDYFNAEFIAVSKYGIREGYLYEKIIKGE